MQLVPVQTYYEVKTFSHTIARMNHGPPAMYTVHVHTVEVHHGDVEGHQVVIDVSASDGSSNCKYLAAKKAQLTLDSPEQHIVCQSPAPRHRCTAADTLHQ